MRRALRWSIRLGLTVVVTGFLLRALRLSVDDVRALEWAHWIPRPAPLLLSVALLLGTFLYLVALWTRLLERLGAGRLPFGRAVRIFFLSLLARYVPGKVWQIAGLAYLASREGLEAGPTAFVALLAQAFSLGAALFIGSLYLWAASPGSWAGGAALAFVVVLALLTLLSHPGFYRAVPRLWSRKGEAIPLGAAEPVGPGFALRWLGLHALAWAGYSAAFCLLWVSFRPLSPDQLWLAATAFPAAYVLGYVAFFAPAGIGVREGALAALTAPALGAADATALAVIARVWMTGVELLPLLWIAPGAPRRRVAEERTS